MSESVCNFDFGHGGWKNIFLGSNKTFFLGSTKRFSGINQNLCVYLSKPFDLLKHVEMWKFENLETQLKTWKLKSWKLGNLQNVRDLRTLKLAQLTTRTAWSLSEIKVCRFTMHFRDNNGQMSRAGCGNNWTKHNNASCQHSGNLSTSFGKPISTIGNTCQHH